MDTGISMCDHAVVARFDPDDERLGPVREAVDAMQQAKDALTAAREALAAQIVTALNAGVRPSAIGKVVPYSQDYIRQIARDGGVAPLREPTVTSIRKLKELQDKQP